MEHVVHPFHGLRDAIVLAHIADIELQLAVVERNTHFFLLFLVAAEDADFTHLGR